MVGCRSAAAEIAEEWMGVAMTKGLMTSSLTRSCQMCVVIPGFPSVFLSVK